MVPCLSIRPRPSSWPFSSISSRSRKPASISAWRKRQIVVSSGVGSSKANPQNPPRHTAGTKKAVPLLQKQRLEHGERPIGRSAALARPHLRQQPIKPRPVDKAGDLLQTGVAAQALGHERLGQPQLAILSALHRSLLSEASPESSISQNAKTLLQRSHQNGEGVR